MPRWKETIDATVSNVNCCYYIVCAMNAFNFNNILLGAMGKIQKPSTNKIFEKIILVKIMHSTVLYASDYDIIFVMNNF